MHDELANQKAEQADQDYRRQLTDAAKWT